MSTAAPSSSSTTTTTTTTLTCYEGVWLSRAPVSVKADSVDNLTTVVNEVAEQVHTSHSIASVTTQLTNSVFMDVLPIDVDRTQYKQKSQYINFHIQSNSSSSSCVSTSTTTTTTTTNDAVHVQLCYRMGNVKNNSNKVMFTHTHT